MIAYVPASPVGPSPGPSTDFMEDEAIGVDCVPDGVIDGGTDGCIDSCTDGALDCDIDGVTDSDTDGALDCEPHGVLESGIEVGVDCDDCDAEAKVQTKTSVLLLSCRSNNDIAFKVKVTSAYDSECWK